MTQHAPPACIHCQQTQQMFGNHVKFIFSWYPFVDLSTDSSTAIFTIEFPRWGNVRHAGDSKYLRISKGLPPAFFCFTKSSALQEVESDNLP